MHRCVISRNSLQAAKSSSLIETLGALDIRNSCFEDNLVGVSNTVVLGAQLSSSMVYTRNSTGQICQYASVFETLQQFDSFRPICVASTESVCTAAITAAPTLGVPTPSPSDYPSSAPSDRPTSKPSTSPSKSPSDQPTGSPSISHPPTEVGETPSPTKMPSASPSLSPSLAPTPDFNFPSPGQPVARSGGDDEDDDGGQEGDSASTVYSITAMLLGSSILMIFNSMMIL